MRALRSEDLDIVGGGFDINPISIIEHIYSNIEQGALKYIGQLAIKDAAKVAKAAKSIIDKFAKHGHGDAVAEDLEKAAHGGAKVLEKVENELSKESGTEGPKLPPDYWVG